MKTYIVTAEGYGERIDRLVRAESPRQAVELFSVCEVYADYFTLGSFDGLDTLICSEVPESGATAGVLEWDFNWVSNAKIGVAEIELSHFPAA